MLLVKYIVWFDNAERMQFVLTSTVMGAVIYIFQKDILQLNTWISLMSVEITH